MVLRALFRSMALWAHLVYARMRQFLATERFTLVAAAGRPMLQPVRVPVMLLESDFRPGRLFFTSLI
jgi:hypothetical protein